MNTDKNNTERLSYLAHELRLCNFSKKCGAVIHQAQVDRPSYLDFLCSLFMQELADRNVEIYVTYQDGNIIAVSDGSSIEISTEGVE